MSSNNRVIVGRIVGAFGIKGWVKVKSYTQPVENILSYTPISLVLPSSSENSPEQEVEIVESNLRPQGLVVRFKGVDDRNSAERLNGAQLEVSKETFPELTGEDFYWHELIGLTVVSEYEGDTYLLGQVRTLLETGANDVLVVQRGKDSKDSLDNRERLIPYVPDVYVLDIDLKHKRIVVTWDPEF